MPDFEADTYGITDYGRMLADSVRMTAYIDALKEAVTPGSVVVDIGTGAGIFALLACKFGAGKVYAIESNDSIQIAQELAKANGFDERIDFIQDISTRVTLPESVDVMVSDLRGILPLYGWHIPSIIDARNRFLKPGGVQIPRKDLLWGAVVEAEETYRELNCPWAKNDFGLDLKKLQTINVQRWKHKKILPEQLISEPVLWAELDYTRIESTDVSAKIEWQISRAGTGHGFNLWFDSKTGDDAGFSAAPGKPPMIYGNGFFPWPQPLELAAGDVVQIELKANLVGTGYIWRWNTIVRNGTVDSVKAEYKQSTFLSEPVTPANLSKTADSHVPVLDENGRVDRFVLERMDGEMAVGEIAEQLASGFPDRFKSGQEALIHVSALSRKYSR